MSFLLIPSIQNWVLSSLEITLSTLRVVSVILFVGELIVFPLYLKKLKNIVEQSQNSHNYIRRAFLMFVLLTLIRAGFQGWQKFVCLFLLLVVPIELAKSIDVIIRYILHFHETAMVNQNEEYEIVEFYDISAIKKRLQKRNQ